MPNLHALIAIIAFFILSPIAANPLKVANGSAEIPHSSPWQAKLYLSSSLPAVNYRVWPCGGTLISQNYILTAARCFTYQKTYKASSIYLYLGIHDIQNREEASLYVSGVNLSEAIIHEDYNATTHENDIALIKLPATINYTQEIQPAQLALEQNVTIGDVGQISGWQYPLREWDPEHQYIHGGNVTVVENSVCQETYPNYKIDDNTICASGTVAYCYGDEGIGLLLNGTIVGLANAAKEVLTPVEECPIIPQTYLSIAKYLDWIVQNSDYQLN